MAVNTLVSPENIPFCVNGSLTPIAMYYVAQQMDLGKGINVPDLAALINVSVTELAKFLKVVGDTALATYKTNADAEEAAAWE